MTLSINRTPILAVTAFAFTTPAPWACRPDSSPRQTPCREDPLETEGTGLVEVALRLIVVEVEVQRRQARPVLPIAPTCHSRCV